MRVRMYLFPGYVTVSSARRFSPKFFQWLEEQGVEIVPMGFDDSNLRSIENDEPAIVRASSVMQCSMYQLLAYCNDHGHLLFYNDMCPSMQTDLHMQRGDSDEFAVLVAAAEQFLASRRATT
jgi:hypothetical protein